MKGLHLVANLYQCRGDARYLTDSATLRQFCLDTIVKSGLTVVGDMFHQFEGGGVTGAVVLAESHLAIHTWPELDSVTLDVYVCNYTQDNGDKARSVMDAFMDLYRPGDFVRHDVPRDEQFMYEWLNPDYGYFLRSSKRLATRRTEFQDLEIHDTPQFGKLMRLDGCFQTSERDEFHYHENLIHPALTALAEPRRVLIIGGGDGGAAEEALKHPSVEQVTMVELDTGVVAAAREHLASVHRGALDSPRLRLLIADGMKFIAETSEKFDLIALDLPDPIGPATALYEQQFFADCKHALSPGGALVLHMGSPVARPECVRDIFQRLAATFGTVRPCVMFIPLYGALWSMAVCADHFDPLSVPAAEIDKRIARRGIEHLQYYNGATHHAVFALPNFVRDITVGQRTTPTLVGKRRAASGK